MPKKRNRGELALWGGVQVVLYYAVVTLPTAIFALLDSNPEGSEVPGVSGELVDFHTFFIIGVTPVPLLIYLVALRVLFSASPGSFRTAAVLGSLLLNPALVLFMLAGSYFPAVGFATLVAQVCFGVLVRRPRMSPMGAQSQP